MNEIRPAMLMKLSRAHPVSRSCHTVGQGAHAATRHVKFLGRAGTRPDGDTDVDREGDAYYRMYVQVKISMIVRCWAYCSSTLNSLSSWFIFHT
jgi:hypothetical protein